MGATVFCVSKSMSVTQRELLLSRTHCGWLLSDQREVSSSLRQINWSDIRNVKDNGPSTPAIVDANKPWIYVSGSGSTGQPKILPVTHEQQLHRANLALKWAPYDDADVLVSLVSMHFYAAKQRFLEAMVIGSGTFVGEVGRTSPSIPAGTDWPFPSTILIEKPGNKCPTLWGVKKTSDGFVIVAV